MKVNSSLKIGMREISEEMGKVLNSLKNLLKTIHSSLSKNLFSSFVNKFCNKLSESLFHLLLSQKILFIEKCAKQFEADFHAITLIFKPYLNSKFPLNFFKE